MKRSWPLAWSCGSMLCVSLTAAPQLATALPVQQTLSIPTAHRAEALSCTVQLPAEFAPDRWYPLVVLLPDGANDTMVATTLGEAGFLVVSPAVTDGDQELPELFARLRQTWRIDQGGMHAAGGGSAAAAAIRLVMHNSHEFQTLTIWGGATREEAASVQRLRERRVTVLATPSPAELRQHFLALHAERTETGPAGDVARTLDDFHDAAAKGDGERYFTILPDDAVFLGTDATERWTGAHFRKFAMPYFERGPAWTYVPLRRHVTVAEGGALAWFDEVLDNQSYGECRGSGVLERRGGRWVIRQYNLTVPVPNALMRGVAERIRAFAAGQQPPATTVVIVRHAEKKADEDDPMLADAGVVRSFRLQETLESLDIAAVYTSEFRRAAATAGPLCRSRKIESSIVPAADVAGLAARIRKEHPGRAVLVVGHSNTVPAIIKALGIKEPVKVAEDEYDRMFVVTMSGDEVRLLSLRYGGA